MERRVLIDTWQKVTRDDFLKFGTFPQASFDTVVGKLLIPDLAFEGFVTVQSGAARVTVANGHLFSQGKVFVNDTVGGTMVDLLSRLPAATKRIAAITVWGVETDAKLEARTFLADADTRATVTRETATEHWRWANIGVVSGDEGPDPQSPAIAPDVCVVAWVTLTTTGIESIVRATDNLTPTLRGEDTRLNVIDAWRTLIGTLLDTLRSDLTALAARILGLAPFSLVRQTAHDIALVKDVMRLPDDFTSYAVDHFMNEDESDTEHVDWLARVEEGVRFPPAEIRDSQLALYNIFDSGVIATNNVVLPAWDPLVRITNVASNAELSIAQYQFQTVQYIQRTMSRQVQRWGSVFDVSTSSSFYQEGVDSGGWFTRAGESFNIVNLYESGGVLVKRLQKFWVDTIIIPYWDTVTTNYSVSGAFVGETFLNGQDGWLCKIDVYFSKVAVTGDVVMMITNVTANGSPDPTSVIAKTTVAAADLHVSPATPNMRATSFNFNPTFLSKGRYAIVLATAGNHFVWVLKNTNFVSGTLFYSTDASWFMGDLVTDLAFVAYFCKFRANMTKVQLTPLQLSNGISAVDINADAIIPDGCLLTYEVQKDGVWHAFDEMGTPGGSDYVLNGLPPLIPFRASFVGTDSVQPALGLLANSRVMTWRPRSDFQHVSEIRTCPSATVISVDIRLGAWRGAPYHTFTCRLMYGAGYTTIINPDLITSEIPGDDLNGIIYHYTFTSQGALTSFRLRLDGDTDNVVTCFHVAERFDIETS